MWGPVKMSSLLKNTHTHTHRFGSALSVNGWKATAVAEAGLSVDLNRIIIIFISVTNRSLIIHPTLPCSSLQTGIKEPHLEPLGRSSGPTGDASSSNRSKLDLWSLTGWKKIIIPALIKETWQWISHYQLERKIWVQLNSASNAEIWFIYLCKQIRRKRR